MNKKSSRSSHQNSNKGYKRKVNRKLILAAVISALVFLSISGYAVYKLLIIPKLVEPALEKVAEVMLDDKYESAITKEIRRLYEAGQVSGPEIEKYLIDHDENVSDYIPDAVYKGGSYNPVSDQNNKATPTQAPKTSSQNKAKSSLGIHSVNVRNEDEDPTDNITDNTITDNTTGNTDSNTAPANGYPLDSTSSSVLNKEYSSSELYAKAKAVMSASDYATAMTIASKIDINKIKSLKDDQTALVNYIQSTLTPDEYTTAISLYAKYANAILE